MGNVMLGSLGIKLRRERENLRLTQEDLANAVGLSSEFISLLEIGKRSPSLDSLRALAQYLKKDVAFFLSEKESPFQELKKAKESDRKFKSEIKKFQKYCEDYLDLEELSSRRLESAPLYSCIIPEQMAVQERRRIGLGNEPIRDIFSTVEMNGLRIYRHPLDNSFKTAGIFIYLEDKQAAFALVNNALPDADQVVITAHLYAHFLKDRNDGLIIDNPDVFVDEYLSLYHPRERFAQEFALEFLMPESKIQEILKKDLQSKKPSYEDAVYMRRYFGVGPSAMLRRLRNLGAIGFSKYKEYLLSDHVAYEETLFGKTGKMSDQRSKRRSLTSDRFRSMGVAVCAQNDKQ